jgi:hypothetical protein
MFGTGIPAFVFAGIHSFVLAGIGTPRFGGAVLKIRSISIMAFADSSPSTKNGGGLLKLFPPSSSPSIASPPNAAPTPMPPDDASPPPVTPSCVGLDSM